MNLDNNLRPLIITTPKQVLAADALAENVGIADRLDILDAEQFLAGNVYELGRFSANGRRVTTQALIEAYNRIVEQAETDPSLQIRLG